MRMISYEQDNGYRIGRAWKIKAHLFQGFYPDDSIVFMRLEEELNTLKLGNCH